MAAVSVRSLRDGLRENLKAIQGIQVSRYFLVNPTPPGIHILPPSVEYHGSMHSGLTTYTFTIQAFTSLSGSAGDISSQILLDELLDETGPRSVVAALEADPTLGGVAQDVTVDTAASAQPQQTLEGLVLLTSDWTARVFVNGST